jgi:hypothetical protein
MGEVGWIGGMTMDGTVVSGNATVDGSGDTRGWILGHFLTDAAGPRRSEQVEIKWGVHASGDRRPRAAASREATTFSILVSGRFRVLFPDSDVLLARPGDYVLWGPGMPHRWQAEADSVVLTVRWPSKAGDVTQLAE